MAKNTIVLYLRMLAIMLIGIINVVVFVMAIAETIEVGI